MKSPKSKITTNLISEIPFGFLALDRQLASEGDLVHSALLHLTVNGLLNPLNFFLRVI